MSNTPARKARTVRPIEPKPEPAPEVTQDRVELVAIDGVSYTVPAKVPPNLVVKYLWLRKTYDIDYALVQIIEDLAGPALMVALMRKTDLTYDELNSVFDGVRDLIAGRVVAAAGN